jgi:tRNA(Arg) A34 adenosine deaminase TadA
MDQRDEDHLRRAIALAAAAPAAGGRPFGSLLVGPDGAEPCAMCAYAIDRSGLGRVVFALSAEQFQALSRTDDPKRVPRDGPALFDEARAPIDAFFTGGPGMSTR